METPKLMVASICRITLVREMMMMIITGKRSTTLTILFRQILKDEIGDYAYKIASKIDTTFC